LTTYNLLGVLIRSVGCSMKFSFAVLSIVILGALGASCAPAQAYPFPWFTEHIQLGSMDLPRGVSVEYVTPPHERLSTKAIAVRNLSSTVLYVVGTHFVANPSYEDISVKLAPGVGPLNKIVNGQAYKWNDRFDVTTSSDHFSWEGEENFKQSDSVWLGSDTDNRIASDEGTVVDLKPLNKYGGQRPPDVKIPNPQDALLPLVYGTQVLNIPITISYSLNKDYQPEEPSFFPDYIPISLEDLLCFLIVPVIFGVGIIWFMGRARADSTKSSEGIEPPT
jgi:hypothetical protein